jgi:hypothetical protein
MAKYPSNLRGNTFHDHLPVRLWISRRQRQWTAPHWPSARHASTGSKRVSESRNDEAIWRHVKDMDGSSETEMTDEEGIWVDSVVAETSPIKDSTLAQLDLTKGFDDLLANIFGADIPRKIVPLRRRRISRRAGTLTIAALVVASAGAAAAVKGGALTGIFGTGKGTESDASEYVDVAASNYPTVARQLFTQLQSDGLRFAPGTNIDRTINAYVKQEETSIRQLESGNSAEARSIRTHGLEMQVTGIKGVFASMAQCTWQQSWMQAYQEHDGAGKNAAIRGMKSLNAVITTTPSKHGTFSGSIMAETNQKKALDGYVRHMQHNDFEFIQRVISINCGQHDQ